ncbi:MAG: PDZ domain-containing protein [Desulfobulbaceae bacterium]|nr:MAG: PDZ domain-containing protein [Desulfobulbaceae bacterium]
MKQVITLILTVLFNFSIIVPLEAKADVNYSEQLTDVLKLVEKYFYDADAVSGNEWKSSVEKLQEHIDRITGPEQFALKVNSLLATLDTSHTYYFSKGNPKRYQLLGIFKSLYEQERSDLFVYEGIGVDTEQINGHTEIVSVFDGFPAQKAGLRFGDRILSVNSSEFHPINSFLGLAGEVVRVKIDRQGKKSELNVDVANIDGRTMFEKAASLSVRSFDHEGTKIGYIHLWSYAGTQYQELLRQQVLWGELSKCDALILDLRDGWGGADLNYLNLFRDPIAKTTSQARDGSTGAYSGVWEKPVALLVNERSTSGKELFAYGFKKLRIGPVVGSQTAGAVVAGRIFLLSSGDVLYLAVRDVLVDGIRLEGQGVEPDVVVDRPRASFANEDLQLQKAIEEILGIL